MKNLKVKIIIFTILTLFSVSAFSLEKVTIFYKNGDKLKCMIDKYEIGKYAEVVDENGNKRIISWDSINEIIFVWIEDPPKPAPVEAAVPVTPPVVEPAAPAAAAPVTPPASQETNVEQPAVPQAEQRENKSMLEQFNKDKQPAGKQPAAPSKQDKFREQIKEENKSQKPEVDINKTTGKVGVEYYQTLESDATRRAWIEDGGLLKCKGFTANYSYTSFDSDDLKLTMHGIGMTYSGTLKWIKPPNYAEGRNLWTAFSLGAMGSFNMTFGSMPMRVYAGMNPNPPYQIYWKDTEANLSVFTNEISLPIGYTFGLGKYFSSDSWKGVMLGLYWKPNFVMSMVSMELDGTYMDPMTDTQFNFSGVQWTIDWGSFGAMADKLAQEAHLSINGYIIPETDVTPFMFSIGLGLVWY